MRTEKPAPRRVRQGYGWQELKQDIGALGGLLAFLAAVLGMVMLPGILADNASTVADRPTRTTPQSASSTH